MTRRTQRTLRHLELTFRTTSTAVRHYTYARTVCDLNNNDPGTKKYSAEKNVIHRTSEQMRNVVDEKRWRTG